MSLQPAEEWRDVPGYEGFYKVSSLGRVYSAVSGRLLTLTPNSRHGYFYVSLHRPASKKWDAKVHRLVAMAFLPKREGDYLVRHLNGDLLDNRVDNLAWGTQSENGLDSVRHGTHNNASKTHCKYGHEFSMENTGFVPSGRDAGCRYCIACRRVRDDRPVKRRRLR